MKEKLLLHIEQIGLFIGILILTIIISLLFNRFFKRLVRKSTDIMKSDPTNYQFLRHALNAIIYIIGLSIAIYSIPNLRILANSLLAGAGVLAVAVGFASQHALSNIVSGVFIIIFKPFRLHDRLKIGDNFGVVEDITLRHTVIRNFENKRIIIPNAIISNEVIINSDFTDEKICKWIEIGISYDSNVDLAKKIIKEEIIKHPLHMDPRTEEQIDSGEELAKVRVIGFGDSSVNLRGWAWSKDSIDAFEMSCNLMESIKKRFDQEGIEIPFPHRTLIYKNGESEVKNK